MPRARNIKPGMYKNEDLAECSIWARYLFPGLWMMADREGRLEDRPKRLKGELLPFDAQDVEPLLRELHDRGFIWRYRNSDGAFIQILKFRVHQAPHYSEKNSVIKPPDIPELRRDIKPEDSGSDGLIKDSKTPEHSGNSPPIKRGSQPPDSLIPDSLIPDSLIPDSGKEQRSPQRGSRLAFDALQEPWRAYCQAQRPDLSPQIVWENFRDYWVAKPGKDGMKADWFATWRTWVRREGARSGNPIGKQAALEEHNRIVAENWKPPETSHA